MFSLNAGGRDLALPQRNGPGFVDCPWEPLPFWVEWMGGRLVGGGGSGQDGKEKCGWNVKEKFLKN